MSHLFTSSSKQFSWRRIALDVVAVLIILLVLEVLVRIPPIHDYLSAKLDTYENLLWYNNNAPIYTHDLERDPNYTIWLMGSSYMKTGIEPLMIQAQISEALNYPVTAQNLGLETLTNLKVMAELFDNWFLQIDQPEYIVLVIGEGNFSKPHLAQVLNGDFERVFIFPDSLSDYAGAWIYSHSDLYRYLILSRNASIVPYERTLREPLERGGYIERPNNFDCKLTEALTYAEQKMARGKENLLAFITMAKSHDIPLLIINLPLPDCTIQTRYADFEEYQELYLNPVKAFVEQHDISFYELDTQFHELYSPEEQNRYFSDDMHPSVDGTVIFSEWTAEIIAEWISSETKAD